MNEATDITQLTQTSYIYIAMELCVDSDQA